MQRIGAHLRNKLLAGGLAAGPVVIVAWGMVWLEMQTRPLTTPLGVHFPGLGVILALVLVYLLGLLVTSMLGTILLRLVDRVLQRLPGLNLLYRAWKDVWVLPPSKAGIFHQVVLVPHAEGRGGQLAFTCGEAIPGDASSLCVFVPGAPNPIAGQLLVVDRAACVPLAISTEDAFKFLLSTGNHLPTGLHGMSPRDSKDSH